MSVIVHLNQTNQYPRIRSDKISTTWTFELVTLNIYLFKTQQQRRPRKKILTQIIKVDVNKNKKLICRRTMSLVSLPLIKQTTILRSSVVAPFHLHFLDAKNSRLPIVF